MTRHQWWARPIRALVVTATRTLAAAILAPAIGCGENRTVPGSPTGPASPTPPLRTTWSVGGTVTDSLLAVGNARVEIVSGDGAGASTITGPGGNYLLRGAAGDVEVRASLPGLESQVRSVRVTSDRTDVHFALVPTNPADVAGAWRLTIEASPLCHTLFENARTRTYQAIVSQTGGRASVEFVGSTVLASEITAVIYEKSARFLVGFDPYDSKSGFRERVAADGVFAVSGWVHDVTVTSSWISGRLEGSIATYQVPPDAGLEDLLRPGPITSSCWSPDHRFTLER